MSSYPKDVLLTVKLLDDCGVLQCDQKVLPMLVELNYRIQRGLLKQGCIHAERMKHTVVSDNEITLAIQLHERTTPSLKPNPMNSYNVAQNINSVPFDVAYSHSVDEMKPYTSTYTQLLSVVCKEKELVTPGTSQELEPLLQVRPPTFPSSLPTSSPATLPQEPSIAQKEALPSIPEFPMDGDEEDEDEENKEEEKDQKNNNSLHSQSLADSMLSSNNKNQTVGNEGREDKT